MKTKLIIGLASILTFCSSASASKTIDSAGERGFYVGVGVGTFVAANKFKANENNYAVAAKPKANPAVLPSLMVGYQFNENFRADLNAQFRKFKYSATLKTVTPDVSANLSQDNIKNYSVFVNGYAGMSVAESITSYLTAGVGASYFNPGALVTKMNLPVAASLNRIQSGKNTVNFAWNVGAGVRVGVLRNLDLDLAYRYVSLGETKVNSVKNSVGTSYNGGSQKIRAHEGLLALVYKF